MICVGHERSETCRNFGLENLDNLGGIYVGVSIILELVFGKYIFNWLVIGPNGGLL
jgi:hypothetical protein